MNNVWTSVAARGCATRQAKRSPLLQLFRGYAQWQNTKCTSSRRGIHNTGEASTRSANSLNPASRTLCQPFSTSIFLSARKKRSAPRSPAASIELEQPAQTASHTEGAEPPELTWRDFDPEGGMPLPNGELGQAEIRRVFGDEEMSVDLGNYILSIMYWRRVSGALIDDGIALPATMGVSQEQAMTGLEYVRSLDPEFDEQAAGELWAEEETQRLGGELQERAVKLKLYKREEDSIEEEEESDQGTEYGRERTGESVLQTTREAKEAQYAQEQAEKEAAKEREAVAALHSERGPLELSAGVQPSVQLENYTSGGISITSPSSEAWLVPHERSDWVKYYEEQAQIIKTHEIPQMSTFRRLAPSALVLLATLAAALYLSETYTPPPTSARLFPDTPPAIATLGTLTALLCTTFILSRFPPLWRTSSKYFCLVPAFPYAVSLLGATLRHGSFSHLAGNVISLWLFGVLLHEDVGRGTFLAIALASAAAGNFASLAFLVRTKGWNSYIFGASASILGVVAAACTLRPNGTITVWGYDLPVAAWVFLALYAGAETVAVVRMRKSDIDHGGHIGGLATGLGAAVMIRRSVGQRERDASERKEAVVETAE